MGALLLLLKFFFLFWPAMATSTFSVARSNCSHHCGNITVPYPFGFGDEGCYRDDGFILTCDTDYNPPKLFFGGNLEVLDISLQGQIRVMNIISRDCYNTSGWAYGNDKSFNLTKYPVSLSDTDNRLTALGCDTKAFFITNDGNFFSQCSMQCGYKGNSTQGFCSPDSGCCQITIPKSVKSFNLTIGSIHYHSQILSFNPCSYAFVVDVNWYNFSLSDLMNFGYNKNEDGIPRVPVVLDWAIEEPNGLSCEKARKDHTTYACGKNSECHKSKNELGYSCNCSKGYQGNPYLLDGCQDINECLDQTGSLCSWNCINMPGNFTCSCPPGFRGDGKKNGTGCNLPLIPLTVGIGLGCLFLLVASFLTFFALQKRKANKLKQKFFQQNGGFLLKQQLSSHEGSVEVAKIFTAEELKKATNNYAQDQIIGRGGYGTVYKGILLDHRVVAIKKSKIVDESQIEQFINEVVILSQTNHRNVVKLLGCCLETEVPTLVYEFVTNKTLFHHIHDDGCNSRISWNYRLRIAAETSEAIAYLHSAASPPIIHRDIKSVNILLDDNYSAKVSDFGASRLVPLDQTQISTLVQGTLGYLDPEYLQSSQLTEKSDVYSFGVVLLELLTGKKALYSDGPSKDVGLAMHFITSIKEGRVWDILDDRVIAKGCKEQLHEVILLAERCLRIKGEKRPKMKEVAMELQRLSNYQKHPWVAQNPEEVEALLGEPSDFHGHHTIGYDSMTNQVAISLDGGR